jgi:molecular chaperone DnaK
VQQLVAGDNLFIATEQPPALRASVEITLQLPNRTRLVLYGQVTRVITAERAAAEGQRAGIGVTIGGEHAIDLLILDEMARAETTAPAAEPAEPKPAAAPRPSGRGQVARLCGIDFGTTNSSISVAIGDRVYLIPDAEGQSLQPSVVSYPRPGVTLVGRAARERLATDPARTIASAKRLLGRSYSDPAIAGHLHAAAYRTTAGPNDTILAEIDGEPYAIGQVCAAVLAHLREQAERQLIDAKQAVVSVPVTFGDGQRNALLRAGQLAGIDIVGFIEEPLASALAYGFGQGNNEIVAAYDFGGGTFDFTVLDLTGERFRVLVSAGDPWLGGDDFDLALAQYTADAFWRKTKVELQKRAVEWQRLLFACEQAKRALSREANAVVTVERILETPKPIDLSFKVERRTFEQLCRDLFERSLAICRDALASIGLDPRDITHVVLSSGISNIPFVRAGLGRLFERDITAIVNPEQAICLGAGLDAARRVGHAVAAVRAPR